MRIAVDHRTTYRFTAPQNRLVQLLRVTPANSHDQTVARWTIHVDRDARMRTGADGFGNIVTMLYAEGPIEAIAIEVSGEVVTSHSDGVVHGAVETLPPAFYLRDTALTPADPAIADWARAVADGRERLAALHALNGAVHDLGPVDDGRGEPGRDAGVAWAAGARTPRDLAQVLVVAARAIGAPARYVSGYHLAGRGEEHHPAPHAWMEAQVDGIGWIGFDPATGLCPEEHYVRVAVAPDAAGAAPVAGSRLGEGREELEVDVAVSGQGS